MENLDAKSLRNTFHQMTEQPIETGYLGPGIWIRIQHRFRTRMTEWLLAVITALWGLVILLPGEAFDQPAFSGFRAIFGNEEILGSGMVILGLLRIGGLIVNGARKNVTPHIRMFSAGCGCLIFFGISYCYMLSGIVAPWIAIYPPFVLCELVNAYRAAHDVGESHGRNH
jgi:hypothetical protein